MRKRIASMLLVLAMLAGFSGSAFAAEDAAARLPAKNELNAQWFKNRPATSFNRDIALMAACLTSNEGEFKTRYGAPGKPLAMEEFSAGAFWFGVEHPVWKIGSIQLKDATIVVVKLNGSGAFGSGQYLVTNFMGYGGYAVKSEPHFGYRVEAGYKSYADAVWEGLSGLKHLFEGKGNLKLLITGHSMGGAGANLLGVRLEKEDNICGTKLSREDIYVYTFESPSIYLDLFEPHSGTQFGNIHNFVNSVDIAVLFMPGQRFGKTYMFPCVSPENDRHHPNYQEYRQAIDAVNPAYQAQRSWIGNILVWAAMSIIQLVAVDLFGGPLTRFL